MCCMRHYLDRVWVQLFIRNGLSGGIQRRRNVVFHDNVRREMRRCLGMGHFFLDISFEDHGRSG